MRISASVVIGLWWVFVAHTTMSYAASSAVERPLPADGKLGELSVSERRQFLIDDDVRQLTAGAQIRSAQNTLIQPQALIFQLVGLKTLVLYTDNNQGQVHRIWLLSKPEARHYASKLPPPPPPVPIPNPDATPPMITPPDRAATPSTSTE